MIQTIENNLKRGVALLNSITEAQYTDTTVAPYYSSIGSHMRHILDMFDCVFLGISSKSINFTERKRNSLVEEHINYGINYFNQIIEKLNSLTTDELKTMITLSDDLGDGIVTVDTTIESVLMQAHSHAIHHYASLGYVIAQLGVELPFKDFGFNPTTPEKSFS